jgi:hypothetical protein
MILRDMTPKAHLTKVKIDKLKMFCIEKTTFNVVIRQPMEWKKICGNQTPDKGLISKIKYLIP